MNFFRAIWRWLRSFSQRRTVKRDIDEELRFHIEQRTTENIAAGLSPEEAARAARKSFGNLQNAREECRRQSGASFGETMLRDIRFGGRMLWKDRSYALVAALTLALGIGAATAIFSAVYGVLISPYPYGHPGEIWAPGVQNAQSRQVMRPYRRDEFESIAALPEFSTTMGTMPGSILLTGEFAPEMLTAPHLTLNAFQFLEVPPIIGRVFGPGDVGQGGEPQPVTVISYQLWQRLLGGDPKALGRTLRLDDKLYTVIGVMPPRFGWWTSDGLWLPMPNLASDSGRIFPISRMKSRDAAPAARQHLHALQLELARIDPGGFPEGKFDSMLTNYLDMTVASGEMQKSLAVLLAAVAILLLIACANVASLQLARSSARAHEMAIRLSIGATRGRLIRQLLTESVLLSTLGGALGLAFATALTHMLVILMPDFYVPNEARIEVNGHVLFFCVVISVLTGVLFGLAPAFQNSSPTLTDTLKDEGKGFGSARSGRFRAALVVAEVALSVILLVSAGLTTRSFLALHTIQPGFHADRVVTFDFTLPMSRYPTIEKRLQFCRQLLEDVQNLPGVESAELGNGGLPFGGPESPYSIDGATRTASPVMINLVSADYLKTLGIALERGRNFDSREIVNGDHYAIINEAAAKLWPNGEDPVGRPIHFDLLTGSNGGILYPPNSSPEVTVIGVCADTHNDGLAAVPRPMVLVPYTLVIPPDRSLAVRATGNPATLLNAIREQAKRIDPQLPLRNFQTIPEAMQNQAVQPRFIMILFCMFGVFALALATAGIYSVLSYSVTQRTREIGVRMALGAQRRDVFGLILKNGGKLAVLGILLGTIAGIGAARFVASQISLYYVEPTDLVSFLGVIALLGLVSAAACWFPARRATKVDPMAALRHQ